MSTLALTSEPRIRVTLPRVTHSELLKIWTLRSTYAAMGAAVLGWCALTGILMLTASASSEPGDMALAQGPIALAPYAAFIFAVMGVLASTSEWASGMSRTTFAAVPRRLTVLGGKAAAVALSVIAGSVVAIVINMALVSMTVGVGEAGGLLAAGSLLLYARTLLLLTSWSVLGTALGFVVRSTAGAMGLVMALIYLAPGIVALIPVDAVRSVMHILPLMVGNDLLGLSAQPHFGPWAAAGIIVAWVAAFGALAAASVRRRDI